MKTALCFFPVSPAPSIAVSLASLRFTATMSTKRPSYVSTDVDNPQQDDARVAENSDRRPSKLESLFPKEFHAKDPEKSRSIDKGVEAGFASGNDLPAYEGEEFSRGAGEVVTTAEDLVTRIINVEDDPSLDPWTFRTFFLGTS